MAERTQSLCWTAAAGIVLAVVVLTVASCSPRRWMVREVAASLEEGLDVLEADEDLMLIEKALPANIKLIESLRPQDPENPRIPETLARLYGSYAFAFGERDLEASELLPDRQPQSMDPAALAEAVSRYYRKGADYALESLEARHPGCAGQLKRPVDADACFSRLGPEDLPALFWYGFDLGGYVNRSRSSVRALAQASLAEKAMIRVLEIDPSYYHGGAHLFLMIYYASRPPMMGGRPEAAVSHYRSLKALQGEDFPMADLFYARYYLLRAQDRSGFHEMLETVRSAPAKPGPHRLLDAVAVERAAIYLEAEHRLFP